MPPNHLNRVKEVFSEASELDPPRRAVYLDEACAGDADLRSEVERLLASLEASNDKFLENSSVGEFLCGTSDESQTLSVGDRVVNRFEIQRLIGKGGMGEVYEAEDLQFGGRLALKTLRARFLARVDFAARFRREIQLARKVTHPNVCRIFEVGRDQVRGAEITFLTMELLPGETLSDHLQRGPMNVGEAYGVIRQIAEGLGALHKEGVIHRDLKPANVLLVQSAGGPRAVITDFGLAHTLLSDSAEDSLTMAGQVLGTPTYMAPEQLTGKRIGPEADIYALGIVMYEMLCGRRPFEAENMFESAAQKLAGPPAPPSTYALVDHRWDAFILSCLERDGAKRVHAVTDLLLRLDALHFEPAREFRRSFLRGMAHPVRRYALYSVAATLGASIFTLQIPSIRTPALRQMCHQFPGNGVVCELPAEKGIAVFPFRLEGTTNEEKALAAGLTTHIRESFARLIPNPGKMCVHLRADRQSDGVRLVLEGDVAATRDRMTVTLMVREAQPEPGRSTPLVLRRLTRSVKRSNAQELYRRPLLDLAQAMDVEYPQRAWQAWEKMGPAHAESFLSYILGRGYLATGNYEEAAKAFSAVIDPTREFRFAPAHVGLGEAYRLLRTKTGEAGWVIRARQAYQRAVTLDRDFGFAGAEKRWGQLEAGLGDAKSALPHLIQGLQFWPYDQELQKALAEAFEATGQSKQAENTFRDAVTREPQCWLTHNTLAHFYSTHARSREAEAALLEVVRLAPHHAAAYHNLAFDYIKAARFDDAIETVSKAIQLESRPLYYSTLGRAFLYKGCIPDSLINLQKAIELAIQKKAVRPASYVLWGNHAEGLHAASPNSELARAASLRTIELVREVLEKTPTDAYAWAQYAVNSARLARKADAFFYVRRGLQEAPANHDVQLLAIETLEVAGDRVQALELLNKALRTGLLVHQVESRAGLTKLRDDSRYRELLKQQRIDRAADPGGLTLRPPKSCPAWGLPGKGLKGD